MAVNNYLKNVMKSVAYAAADVTEQYIPSIKEFSSANKDFATATYATLRNPKAAVRRSIQAIQDSKVYKALDYGTRNLFEDLRTGNFYNKERKDRDELAFSGLDTDWDDLSEFGIDGDWESKQDSKSSKNEDVTAGDMMIVNSVEGSNAALASATVNAVITSSQNEIRNNRATSGMLYMQNEKLFGGLHKDMTVLGSTMQQMYKLQDASLRNIDKNLSDFFTQESKLNQERNAMLKEILEIQRNAFKSASDKEKDASGKKKSNRIRWSDINSSGIVNISEYFSAVKKNISNELSSIMPAGFGEDSNMFATMMTSPLEGVMKYVVDGVIPATVKAASKELDGTISGVFGNIIGALGNAKSKNDGGILNIIAKFFGVSTSVHDKIDTSRYEKGPVPFDGITRKAIIDVIPTYLRRIEAILSGRPEEMYDYKAGKWTKVADAKKQFEDIRKSSIKRGTSEIREAMNPGIQAVRRGLKSQSQIDEWDKAVEQFQEYLYSNNGRFNANASASKNGIMPGTALYRHYNKIQQIFKDFDRIESTDSKGNKITRHTKYSTRAKIAGQVLDAKDSEERQYRSIESEVGNAFNSIFGLDLKSIDSHGKYNKDKKFEAYNILTRAKDDHGNTIFNYLHNINKELVWFRLNGRGGNGRGNPLIGPPTPTISIDAIDSIAGEAINRNRPKNNTTSNSNKDEAIKNSALQAIQSGKAVDLRDFSNAELSELLRLSSIMSEGAVGEFKEEISGYNANQIASFIDRHFIKTNIKSSKDIDDAKKKADKEGKNTDEVSGNNESKKNGFFAKIKQGISSGEGLLGGIIGASAESFTNLLYTADRAIYEMMYKTEILDDEDKKQKYNGFIDMMAGKFTDKFKKITDWFKEDILEPFKQRLGWDKDRFTETFKNVGSKLWTSFKDANKSVYGPIIDKLRPPVDYEELERQQREAEKAERKAYHKSRKSTQKKFKDSSKSEIIKKMSIKEFNRAMRYGTMDYSEHALLNTSDDARQARMIRHEIIKSGDPEILEIWCDKNGFKGELRTKKEYLKSEFGLSDEALNHIQTDYDANLAYIKQFRSHAKGTPSGRPFSGGLTTLTKGEGYISGRGMGVVPKTGVYHVDSPTHFINRKDMASLQGRKLSNASIQHDLGKEKLAAKRAGFNVAHHESGTLKLTNNGASLDGKEVLSEAKKNVPEAVAGGLVGGILTSAVGLPLIGAAIGAAASIIKNSSTLSERFLGKLGEDGKRDGTGIISKTVIDSYDKHFPDMKKYGLAGIIPGLITPLGPIGGLLVGSAFGLLKSSEKFKNKYFGEEGVLKIGDKEKSIIEKMLPAAAKGAAGGALTSIIFGWPFGLLGNSILGAGIGMISTSEDFKNAILGEEINGQRTGGIVGAFKDALDPLTESLRNIGSKLSTEFQKSLFEPLGNFIKPAIHALPIAIGAPFRKLNKILSRTRDRIHANKDTRIGRAMNVAGKVLGYAGTGISKGLAFPFKLPGKVLGAAGDGLRAYDIKHGDMVGMRQSDAINWLESTGRNVSSALRASARIGTGTDKSLNKDEAEKMRDYLNLMNTTEGTARRNFREKNDQLNKLLKNYKTSDGRKLSDTQIREVLVAAKNKDFGAISHILQKKNLKGSKDGLNEAEFNTLMDGENGKNSLKKHIMDAVEAETRLYNVKNLSKTEAKEKINTLYERLGINKKDVDLDTKEGRSFLAKLFSDRLTELEANPDDVKTRLEADNHDNIETISDLMQGIYDIMVAKEQGDNDAISQAINKTNSRLDHGKNTANKRYKKVLDDAKTTMGEDFNNVKNPTKLTPWKAKLKSRIVNIIDTDDNIGSIDILHRIFKEDYILDIQDQFDDNAIPALSNLNGTQCGYFKRNIKNPSVYRAIINTGCKITENTVALLADGNNKDLVNNCIKLDQIANKNNDLSIYTKYKSLEQIQDDTIDMADNGIKYGDKTSSKWGDIKRKLTPIGRGLGKFATKVGGALIGQKLLGALIPSSPLALTLGTGYLAYKGVRGIGNIIGRSIRRHSEYEGDDETIQSQDDLPDNAYGTIPMHGIGSMLLGAGKAIVGGAGSLVKSLFGKKDKNKEQDSNNNRAGLFASLFSSNKSDKPDTALSSGNFDETDKAGDGKDIAMIDNTPVKIERGSDGSVDFDTSDTNTKNALNKLSFKERALEKLQNAQLKASELIKNTFDTTNVKGSKGGKLGWFSLLLGGGLLWKSGVLTKLFDGVVKPLWTDTIKPWITDTAVPWIKGTALPTLGGLIKDGFNLLLDKLPTILGTALGNMLKQLPEIIWNGIKGVFSFGSAVLDTVVGNPTNVGAETKTDVAKLTEEYDSDYVTGYTDENGNQLTVEQVANKVENGEKVYNNAGVEGTVDSRGNLVFEDQSLPGSGYAKKVGNASVHAFARSTGGGTNKLINGAYKVSDFISKPSKYIPGIKKLGKSKAVRIASKIPGVGLSKKLVKWTGKAAGTAGKAVTAPIRGAQNAGLKFSTRVGNWSNRVVENAADRVLNKAIAEGNEEVLEQVIKGDGSRFSRFFQKTVDVADNGITGNLKKVFKRGTTEVGEQAAKQTAKEAVEQAAKQTVTDPGLVTKMITKVTEAITGLFSNGTVLGKLKDIAKNILHVDDIAKWIAQLKGKIIGLFSKGMEKGVKKVGVDTCKKVLSKALAIAFLVIDFIVGCDTAESILGVQETGLVEEFVAGILNALCNLIIIPMIVPKDWAISIYSIARGIMSLFCDDFEQRQAEADAAYQKYLQETGSTETKEEWLENQHSYWGKGKKLVKETFTKLTHDKHWRGIGAKIYDLTHKDDKPKTSDLVDTLENKDKVYVTKFINKGFTVDQAATIVSMLVDKGVDLTKLNIDNLNGTLFNYMNGNKDGKIKQSDVVTSLSPEDMQYYRSLIISGSYNIEGAIKEVAKKKNNGLDISLLEANASGTLPISTLPNSNNPNFITNIFSGINDLTGDIDGNFNFDKLNKTMDKVKDGDIGIFSKDYWGDFNDDYDGSLKGVIENAYSKLTKIINLPILMVKDSLKGLVNGTEEIGNTLTGTNNTSSSNGESFGSKIKNILVSAIGKVKDFFGFGTGNYRYGRGKYSKQIDPSIANIRFNSSYDNEYQTIGDSGCGPAAAVNALESMYGRGNTVASAAKFALNNGYKEINGGTKPGFFVDYFNRNGFGARTSYNRSDIENSINSGLPTVIMGSDARGVSSSTPFGKTPHYVTVTGVDGKGNAIVQDPESQYDDQLYPIKSLMKNTSLGVSAYGRGAFGRGRWGRGNYDEQIWWALKQMGMTDAGAAGMMGNLYAESGLEPNKLEKRLGNKINMNSEQYTAAVDNGTISKETFLEPLGKDTQYGYGLAQWTSAGRKKGLYELVKSRGVSISDLGTQLEWLEKELNGGYKGVYKTLTSTDSLNDASDKVVMDFEVPGSIIPVKKGNYNQDQYNEYLDTINRRRDYGKKYFDLYNGTSGKQITGSVESSVNTINNDTSTINSTSTNNTSTTYTTSSSTSSTSNSTTSTSSSANTNSTDSEEEFTISNVVSKTSEALMKLIDDSELGGLFNTLSTNFSKLGDTAYINTNASNNTSSVNNNYSNSTSTDAVPVSTSNSIDYASKMVELAKKELNLGIKEDPMGSDKVKYNDWYWSDKPVDERKQPWCGAFVSWIANQAGVPTSIIPKYAYTPTGYDILSKDGGEVNKASARPGDILFTYSDDDGRISHTGIVTKKSGDNIISIEGNWGNKVSEVTRGIDDGNLYITRPKYDGKGGNGAKPLSRYGQFRNSISNNRTIAKSGYGINYNNTLKHTKVSNKNDSGPGTIVYGMGSNTDYSKLISSIINILMTIADNTDKLNLIVSILNNKLNLNISASEVSNSTGKQTLKSKLSNALIGINSNTSSSYANTANDESINSIILAMNAIASE